MCFAMTDLPEELVEKILFQLDPASTINFLELGNAKLNGLLSNPTTFLRLLGKLQFLVAGGEEDGDEKARRMRDNQELVDKMSRFIRTAADPGPLLASLQEAIVLRFPAKGDWRREEVVLERLPQQPLHVDAEGVLLLLHAREGLVLKTVRLGWAKEVGGDLLAALSSFAAQTPGREVKLELGKLIAVTKEDGRALAQLLATCGEWSVVNLELQGEVGQEAWQGLAGVPSRGNRCRGHGICVVHVDREVARRGAREDLRGAWWDCTREGGRWQVVEGDMWWQEEGQIVYRREGHEGWGRIERWSNGEEEGEI